MGDETAKLKVKMPISASVVKFPSKVSNVKVGFKTMKGLSGVKTAVIGQIIVG